jgi:sec-independent protein translocase protein TatA
MTITAFPLQFGIPGGPELLIILLIAVLLFGANKIPKLARSTGEAMGEFKRGREEVEEELEQMRSDVEGTVESDGTPETETADEDETVAPEDSPETSTDVEDTEFEIAEAESNDDSTDKTNR